MQGGPRRGRSPITGPALPCAAQASQSSARRKMSRPKGGQKLISSRRAGVPIACQTKDVAPEGGAKINQLAPRRRPNRLPGERCHARRAAKINHLTSRRRHFTVPKSRAGRRNPVPQGANSKTKLATLRAAPKNNTPSLQGRHQPARATENRVFPRPLARASSSARRGTGAGLAVKLARTVRVHACLPSRRTA